MLRFWHHGFPRPQAITRLKQKGLSVAVSVTRTVSNGQSGQYFRHNVANGASKSAYLSQEHTRTVQSAFIRCDFSPTPFFQASRPCARYGGWFRSYISQSISNIIAKYLGHCSSQIPGVAKPGLAYHLEYLNRRPHHASKIPQGIAERHNGTRILDDPLSHPGHEDAPGTTGQVVPN